MSGTGRYIQEDGQAWMQVLEIDFSRYMDCELSEAPPELSRLVKVFRGTWAVRDGCLCVLDVTDSILHFTSPVLGDMRVDIDGYVEKNSTGEIAPLLCAPEFPQRPLSDDGYALEFGGENMLTNKVARNTLEVAFARKPELVPGEDYHVRASMQEGLLCLNVNDADIIRLRDYFPLEGSRVGLYAFGQGMRIKKVRVLAAGVPLMRSCIAVPDKVASLGNWHEALEEYQRVIHSHSGEPVSYEAMYKAGLCLIEVWQLRERLREQSDGLKDAKELLDRARRYFEKLDGTVYGGLGAIGLARLADLTGEGVSVEVFHLMNGLIKYSGPKSEGVGDLFIEAQTRAPVLASRGQMNQARELLDALANFPRMSEALSAKAMLLNSHLLQAMGQYREVRELLQRCIDKYHEYREFSIRARMGICKSYMNEGQLTRALTDAQELLNDTPDLAETGQYQAYIYLGDYYRFGGMFTEAEGIYRELSEKSTLRSHQISGLTNSAVAMAAGGNMEKALEQLTSLPARFPDQPHYIALSKGQLIGILFDHGLKDEAMVLIDELDQDFSHEGSFRAVGRIACGEYYIQEKEYDQAEKHLAFVMDEFPHTRQARDASLWRGLVALGQGKPDTALQYFSNLACTDPKTAMDWKDSWFNRFAWGAVMRGNAADGIWENDENEIELHPEEVLRRTAFSERHALKRMFAFRASLDPAWKEFAAED